MNRRRGFTLVELIVVLVILAILAAILVPALTGWIRKSKNRSAILEARTVVQAAQSVAAEAFAKGDSLDDGEQFLDKYEDEILNLAEALKTADIQELVFDNTETTAVGTIRRLVCLCSGGTRVIYDMEQKPVYQLEEESGSGENTGEGTGAVSGAPAYQSSWQSVIAEYVDTNSFINVTGMRDAVLNANGQVFPSLSESEKELFDQLPEEVTRPKVIDSMTWKPTQVSTAKDGYLLTANDSDSRNNINAYLVYYNGAYYGCLNKAYNGKVMADYMSVLREMDLFQLENAKDISYYETHLDEITGKTWVRF